MNRIPIPTVLTAMALVVILVLYLVTYQVRFSEAAIKVNIFDQEDVKVITEPGIRFKWPPPIETVKHYDTRLRVLDTPEAEIKTRDGQNIIVGVYALWRIEDPLLFYIRVKNEREAEEKLRARISEARSTVVGRHVMADFVNLDGQRVLESYDAIQNEMIEAAAGDVRANYGVELVRVQVRRLGVPEEATQTILASMKEERNNEAEGFTAEGRSLAAAITARAESQKEQILAFAERKAQEIEAAGLRATERIFRQIPSEDTEFFVWLRQIEALEAALSEGATIFLDAQSVLFTPFTQPTIDDIQRMMPEPPADARGPDGSAAPDSEAAGGRRRATAARPGSPTSDGAVDGESGE